MYNLIFETIGKDGLSRDLSLYLPGLAPTLSFASLAVRSPFLELMERHFLGLDAMSLKPAMKSIILALLPGLEDETSEDFDRTLRLVASFKETIRPEGSVALAGQHSTGDDFFWQCFFLASITSQSRRSGALAYLVRHLPALSPGAVNSGMNIDASKENAEDSLSDDISSIITSPEPGLLVRCFASGLSDDQLLIQRGFLDLLVSHLPLSSTVLQSRVKTKDLELLMRAAAGVVIRRDMSLNRRLWAWLLGPEPAGIDSDHTADLSTTVSDQQHVLLSSRTSYFEDFGLQRLTKSLLEMISSTTHSGATERTRPYRICLSLMDRWEIGGLVVPEIFLPVVESVRQFQAQASTKAEFAEVLRSASVFFDGIESGLIYSELVGLLAQAIGPGSLSFEDRSDKLSLISFVISSFNVREEEMITIHAPLTCLAALSMLEDSKTRKAKSITQDTQVNKLAERVIGIVSSLLELIPERAFPNEVLENASKAKGSLLSLANVDLLRRIRNFYVNEQGSLEASAPPFRSFECGVLLLDVAVRFIYHDIDDLGSLGNVTSRVRLLLLILCKIPKTYKLDEKRLLSHLSQKLNEERFLSFLDFSSILHLVTQMYSMKRISTSDLSELVGPLVRHGWFYLSASEPKHHVEAVRCLWQLQTALTASRRDVEASLADIIVRQELDGMGDVGRTLGVLWSHSLQDNQSDRRGQKFPVAEFTSAQKLHGMDHYDVMLTQPLFLVLDALQDERTQLYMTIKAWLNSMVGIDR